MILLKANLELKTVFHKMINTMGENVKWTEIFVINNNDIILVGTGRSLFFNFDNKRTFSNIVELSIDEKKVELITHNDLLENTLNMILYAFGKWGGIKGLKVETDYEQLNRLINNILEDIAIQANLSSERLRFFKEGVQLTYEEVVQAILDSLRPQRKTSKEEAEEVESDEEDVEVNSKVSAKDSEKDNPEEDSKESHRGKDNSHQIGLWHNLRWKSGSFSFSKEEMTQEDKVKSRLGKNFYMTNYKCPICKDKLYMVIYPVGREFRIETEEEATYLARAYTCNKCNCYYTPKPHKLIIDGDAYHLTFEEDREAYEDYLELLGRRGSRTSNFNFNVTEAEYKGEKKEEPPKLEEICDNVEDMSEEELIDLKDKMDSDFYPETSVEKFYVKVVRELKSRLIHEKNKGKGKKAEAEKEKDHDLEAEKNSESNSEDKQESSFLKKSESQHSKKFTFGRWKKDIVSKTEQDQKEQSQKEDKDSLNDNAPRSNSFIEETPAKNTSKDSEQVQAPVENEIHEPEVSNREILKQNKQTKYNISEDPIEKEYLEEDAKAKSPLKQKRQTSEKSKQKTLSQGILKRDSIAWKAFKQKKHTIEQSEKSIPNETKSSWSGSDVVTNALDGLKEILATLLEGKQDFFDEKVEKLPSKLLLELKKLIQSETGFKEKERTDYLDKIEKVIRKEKEKELAQKVDGCKGKPYAGIVATIREIKKDDSPASVKDPIVKALVEMMKKQGEEELKNLVLSIPENVSKKQHKQYKEKMEEYKEIDIRPFKIQLDEKRDVSEKQEIAAIIKQVNAKNRTSMYDLYNRLRELEYEERNVAPYLEKIYDKIYAMDEATIERSWPDFGDISFDDGWEAYEEISLGDFLPELKTKMLGMIEKRLMKIKMDECERLVRKLSKDIIGKTEENARIHFYENRKTRREDSEEAEAIILQNALNTFATGREKYEYPIMLCDASFAGDGTEGFVLTPDHIFYNAMFGAGAINVKDIQTVLAGTKFYNKGIYVELENSDTEKISNSLKLDKDAIKSFTKAVNDFVIYLKEKPESRSISYLAKEKHTVKCCYRCGYVFKEGNICPKCGSKFNE